jgi:hypothetical protein
MNYSNGITSPKLKQGTKIKFDCGDFKGTGKICGISDTSSKKQNALGNHYIVEIETISIESEYTHINMFEIFIETI